MYALITDLMTKLLTLATGLAFFYCAFRWVTTLDAQPLSHTDYFSLCMLFGLLFVMGEIITLRKTNFTDDQT